MIQDQTLDELDQRIAIARETLRALVEQAATSRSSSDEERATERIAKHDSQLQELIRQRDEEVEEKSR